MTHKKLLKKQPLNQQFKVLNNSQTKIKKAAFKAAFFIAFQIKSFYTLKRVEWEDLWLKFSLLADLAVEKQHLHKSYPTD